MEASSGIIVVLDLTAKKGKTYSVPHDMPQAGESTSRLGFRTLPTGAPITADVSTWG